MADIKRVLIENYMPYAKGTIIARAIPAIDGLKPVQRRILYTMYSKHLLNSGRTKSSNVVGATMQFHPHGDMAIYEALARMTRSNESLNVPYIDSKGSFGKVYSRDSAIAAPRYTEVRLADICKDLFDGIDEDAVDMLDNYDGTAKEPELLPVKFPTVLINTSSGIAVGMSSSIPSFGLAPVCKATIKRIKGEINDSYELMEVLGAPEFSTRGYIHGDISDYLKLAETGRGTVTVSGTVQTYADKIIVSEIPYRTTTEAITEEIIKCAKSGELKEVVDCKDLTDKKGLQILIELKRGSNVSKVLKKINRLTKLRMQMSFITRVIVKRNDRLQCVEMGLLDLLDEWIDFRINTIQRIYRYRLQKKNDKAHELEAWEKIQGSVEEVAVFLARNTEEASEKWLQTKFDLSDKQTEYLMDMKVREITTNRLAKKLAELSAVRKDIQLYSEILASKSMKEDIIVSELTTIIDKYGSDRTTIMTDQIVETDDDIIKEDQVEDIPVSVVITKRGYVKRLITLRDESNFVVGENDEVKWRFMCSNRDSILVFTYSGMCYKIPVNNIDASRGVPKDYIFNLVDRADDSEILHIAPAEDYTGSINIVYSSGRGTKVRFDKVSGNRSRYKNVFEGGTHNNLWCTTENKFFIITRQRRAAYIDLELVSQLSTRSAFKVARINNDDHIFGIQPLSRVPDADTIDLEKYSKGYCIKIKDTLW